MWKVPPGARKEVSGVNVGRSYAVETVMSPSLKFDGFEKVTVTVIVLVI
jgi:hypothetical protein